MSQMVEVNVAELEGDALDWAVAVSIGEDRPQRGLGGGCVVAHGHTLHWFSPSTQWAHGGPLLDKHCKSFGCVQDGTDGKWRAFGYGNGKPFDPNRQQRLAAGPSILIAACRAIVAAKLGDVISIPAELVAP